jgi:hypothetical protein
MIVLKATLQQKQALEGTYKNGALLQFIEDAKGNWVVNVNVINDPNFEFVKEELSNLPQIGYNPKIVKLP